MIFLKSQMVLLFTGAALLFATAVWWIVSPDLKTGAPFVINGFIWFWSTYVIGGVCFFFTCVKLTSNKERAGKISLGLIWGIGIGMRLLTLPSQPIYEVDYNRYLWDGSVTAAGINPYAYSPKQILQGQGDYPDKLNGLCAKSGDVITDINHSQLRTIYPPVAQGVFAVAYFISPFSLLSLRIVLMLFDIGAALLLVITLRKMKLPAQWIFIYWCNPVLVKELLNSCHMDMILLPFICGAFLWSLNSKPIRACAVLTLAAGVKLWPICLVVLAARPILNRPRQLATAATVTIVLGSLIALPVLVSPMDETSGFIAYAKAWQNNDGLFRLLMIPVEKVLVATGGHAWDANKYTRYLVAGLLLVWLFVLCIRPLKNSDDTARRWLLFCAGVFMLSPTGFPWYYTWTIPALVVCPRVAILLYVPLLPIYYLKTYLSHIGHIEWFTQFLIWCEHGPVWFAIAFTLVAGKIFNTSVSNGALDRKY